MMRLLISSSLIFSVILLNSCGSKTCENAFKATTCDMSELENQKSSFMDKCTKLNEGQQTEALNCILSNKDKICAEAKKIKGDLGAMAKYQEEISKCIK